jgi:thiamine-monophosphate kinase
MDRPAEFRLIDTYLAGMDAGPGVIRGIGDDAAVLRAPPGRDLVMTVDTLVVGTHCPADTEAGDIGHRSLAMNLSDLAAMGATPLWALLALTLPDADEHWLAEFAAGFRALARDHGLALVGGNLSRGPRCVTVQLTGHVPRGQWLGRDGARPGDVLLVSGHPGEAAAGLAGWSQPLSPAWQTLRERFLRPEPRIALGRAALGLASAAIDISDGLLADLGHVCAASGCAAEVDTGALPLSAALLSCRGRPAALIDALTGGDDYELLLGCPPGALESLLARAADVSVPLRAIGRFVAGEGVRLPGPEAAGLSLPAGFRHFTGS